MSVRGKSIAGFQIEKVLGKGGMGAVYQAIHPRTGAEVAIKVILRNLQEREEVRERFRREVRAMTMVEHPNLVRILEAGEDDGHSYYVMQLVDGVDLSTYIQKKGPMKIGLILNVATGLYSALAALHDAGVLHRDLKPHNVMLDRSGQPLIMDLGLTRVRDMKTMTRTGALIGSPRYMPPELLEGKPLDARSDLYQAGLILWECATGEVAAVGENFQEVSTRILTGDIPGVQEKRPELPSNLADVIEVCLEVNPDHRIESGHQAIELLEGRTTLEALRLDLEASAAERMAIAAREKEEMARRHGVKRKPAAAPSLPVGPRPPPISSVLRTRVLPIFLFLACLFLGFHFTRPPQVRDPVDLQVNRGVDRIEVSWKDAPATRIQLVVKSDRGEVWKVPENGARAVPAMPDGRSRLLQEGLPPGTRFEVQLVYEGRRTLPRPFETPPSLFRENSPRLVGMPDGDVGILLELHVPAALRIGYPREGSGVSWIEAEREEKHMLAIPDLDLTREGASLHIHSHDPAGGQLQTQTRLAELLERSGRMLVENTRVARSPHLFEEMRAFDPETSRQPEARGQLEELLVRCDLERPVFDFQPIAEAFFSSRELVAGVRRETFRAVEDLRLTEQSFQLLGIEPSPSVEALLQGRYFRGDRGQWREGTPRELRRRIIPKGFPAVDKNHGNSLELELPDLRGLEIDRIRLGMRYRTSSSLEDVFLEVAIQGGPRYREYFRSPTRTDGNAWIFLRELDIRDLPPRGGKIHIELGGLLRPPYEYADMTHYWIDIPSE